MIVTDKRTKKQVCVDILNAGDTFIYENELYLLVSVNYADVDVVSLSTGTLLDFKNTILVHPVKVECTIVEDY